MNLYCPIKSQSQVKRLVEANTQEGVHLDFKGEFWTDTRKGPAREESAKDVAAFLNKWGGTILLGIREDGDARATGFNTSFSMRGRRETLLHWLRSHLAPEAAVDSIGIEEVRVTGTEQGDCDVLVINIDPWPHGPVAVRVRDRESYRFPFRRDRETRWLPWEEIMRRNDAARRVTYLRAMELLATGARGFRLASPVLVRCAGDHTARVRVPADGLHGRIVGVDEGAITLGMTCAPEAEQARIFGTHAALRLNVPNPHKYESLFGQGARQRASVALQTTGRDEAPIPIPLDLVASIWPEPRPAERIVHIMLSAAIVRLGALWFIEAA